MLIFYLFNLSAVLDTIIGDWVFFGIDMNSSENNFINSFTESFFNNIIAANRYLIILDGLKTTVIISIASVLLGTILGSLICWMNMSKLKVLQKLAQTYISILRGTPLLVLLMIIFYIVFASVNIDPVLVAIIAFALNFAAYSSEIFRTGINSINKGQTEAGIALGFSKTETFKNIVLPQAVRRIIPVYKNEMVTLIKMTSIVGYIAVQDLTKAGDLIRSRTFDAFFPLIMIAILYFSISWSIIKLIEYFEHKTDKRLQVKRKKNND